MTYSPTYTITNHLLTLVGSVDAAREVITTAPLVPAWERRFQSEAKIRTIHHGTHLEGNALNLEEVEHLVSPQSSPASIPKLERDVQEVVNYRRVMDYLDTAPPVTETSLRHLHELTMDKLLPVGEAGNYRTVKVVIRNTTTGEITFRPPSPLEIPYHLGEFFSWLTSPAGLSTHPLLRAGILHYELVRIHPFTDGNGRTTRALCLLSLFLEGYELKKFFSLDEYYDADPASYYQALQSASEGNLTAWLEYFVLGLSSEFTRVKNLVQKLSLDLHLKKTIGGKQIALSDRQIKLVEYLEKYAHLGMGEARDLLADVSDDTILRDLRDLVDKGLLTRRGNTKGAKYSLKNP
ncbi:TPA: hypothetical protein DD448_01910 [Candidatus Collierbacteria bacterium]|uniref:Fido domain-containing protein n=1 Tax=Candidatus Collierbacteria bacterium RIFOXYD1_FULL_46_26 TaxID=1817732 RepID=A0A1F5FYN2_9BACT|nr:MAG: hypothetical protein UX32_C0002G0030 [Microgenomates group bacterium GW2011_GWF1_46_12]KKU27994.1 MAG: hypothetical protein UX40_C0004G0024 [Microgenomates group bacterium GW2011_GWF2_46_18]KKU45668.1 MAG: hypothetical protein UX63_C0002G0029 [Microgenomates group bacterium GW2011_GWB1_46_7]KKU61751.1 MAG: hypothetical protein UX82_C0002G0029 [Microgenomates group bacterium GW2011_GWE1_47_12]OGD70273.1 MAG: hypothetical protein A2187_02370 [Candidatus Collierbacteria bacterium RIFOXYA1_